MDPCGSNGTLTFEVYVEKSPTDAGDAKLAADVDTDWHPLSAAFYTPAGTGNTVLNLSQHAFGGCWMRIVSSVIQGNETFLVNQHGSVSQ